MEQRARQRDRCFISDESIFAFAANRQPSLLLALDLVVSMNQRKFATEENRRRDPNLRRSIESSRAQIDYGRSSLR